MAANYKDITSLLFEVSGLNYTVIMQTAGRHTLKEMSVRSPTVEMQPEAVCDHPG